MINLSEFLDRFKKIFQLFDLKPESLIKLGSTNKSDLDKFTVNKCIVSPDFNYDAISALLEVKADILLLFHSWTRFEPVDIYYKKLKYLRDRKICILQFPHEFFSVSHGVHERIGSILGLKLSNLFHSKNFESGRIFEPKHPDFSFVQLLDTVQTKFNLQYLTYVSYSNNLNDLVHKILIYTENPPSNELIIQCYRQDIDTLLCYDLDSHTARTAYDYNIKICDLSFNWINIILEQFVSHDLEMNIPEIKSIFVPSNPPIKIFKFH
ncbi:MAG: Nif3-like dinuclear metal center hexameric protein [Candidatus Helarchaeota archaeon]